MWTHAARYVGGFSPPRSTSAKLHRRPCARAGRGAPRYFALLKHESREAFKDDVRLHIASRVTVLQQSGGHAAALQSHAREEQRRAVCTCAMQAPERRMGCTGTKMSARRRP